MKIRLWTQNGAFKLQLEHRNETKVRKANLGSEATGKPPTVLRLRNPSMIRHFFQNFRNVNAVAMAGALEWIIPFKVE
jgi:hypothetical protein